jgi:hypothetical protein
MDVQVHNSCCIGSIACTPGRDQFHVAGALKILRQLCCFVITAAQWLYSALINFRLFCNTQTSSFVLYFFPSFYISLCFLCRCFRVNLSVCLSVYPYLSANLICLSLYFPFYLCVCLSISLGESNLSLSLLPFLSVCLSIYLSICVSVYPYLSANLICLSLYFLFYLYVYLYIYVSVYLFLGLHIQISTYIFLSVCLSIDKCNPSIYSYI